MCPYPMRVNGQQCVTLVHTGADGLFITEKRARALLLDLLRAEHATLVELQGGCTTRCRLQVRTNVGTDS